MISGGENELYNLFVNRLLIYHIPLEVPNYWTFILTVTVFEHALYFAVPAAFTVTFIL